MAALCKADRCEFFGSDATDGYCSKCFKALFQETPTTTPTTTTPPGARPGATNSTCDRTAMPLGGTIASTAASDDQSTRNAAAQANNGAVSAGAAAEGQSGEGEEAGEEAGSSTATMVEMAYNQKADSSSHCHFCNKRIRLVEKYDCKCGEVFCSTHRHFKAHSCTFDYKASGREAIARANPSVKGSKLKKI